MSSKQTIEIDCPPGNPRPTDLYPGVIKGTGLPEREPMSMFFGNFAWDYTDIPEEDWDKAVSIVKERITTLYNEGIIRYGSW